MKSSSCFLIAFFMCLFSCGKKAGDAGSKPARGVNPIEPDELEVLLAKQELICDQGRCPTYLTKIAILTKDNTLKFCTGVLTDSMTVATTTSCLPEFLRVEGLSCKADVHFFFANESGKPLRAKCANVKNVSQISSKDPTLWRSDVSFFELEKSVDRRALGPSNISRLGMGDLSKFIVWSVDSDNEFVGHIKKNECEAVHNTYFNPFSTNESSPNVTIAGCPYLRGNTGSPVLDYRGRLRGLVSRSIDPSVVTQLQTRGILDRALKPISFAANFACAPTVYDNDVLNFDECTKDLEESESIRLRNQMVSIEELFKPSLLKLEASLNVANRYVKMKLSLVKETPDTHRIQVAPKCFKDVARWIGEFTGRDPFNFYVDAPERALKRSMDEYGRVKALEIDRERLNYTFQFYPRILKNNGKATVFVLKKSDAKWEPYPNISENCSLF